MPFWLALIPPPAPPTHESVPRRTDTQQHAIGCWALQFTPHVVLLEDAVLFEAEGSLRLFGGQAALTQRIGGEAPALGCAGFAFAPTVLAALALTRAGRQDGFAAPLHKVLAPLPLGTLSAAAAQHGLLSQIGCRTLGDVRALPRGGMGRRFGPALLIALDEAYGDRPRAYTWFELPETFEARLELSAHVETAPALLFGAQRLLLQMSGWLAARHAGIRSFTLGWTCDARRGDEAPGGTLTLRTAEPTCRSEHLVRLLSEHLARTTLAAPATALVLTAVDIEPLAPRSASLLPDERGEREPLHQLLERLAARLGSQRVRRAVLASDHRFERMQYWQPADRPQPAVGGAPPDGLPQPSWLLREPLPLAVRDNKPVYQGVLQLLAGPHRIEAGWWDQPGQVMRDYFVAQNEHAGLLWIYRERLAQDDAQGNWFLHGLFG